MASFNDVDEIFSGEFNLNEIKELAEEVDLSQWAGSVLGEQEAEGLRQRYTRDLTVNAEQIIRDLGNERAFEQAGVPSKMMPGRGQRMQNVLGTLRSDDGGVVGPFVRQGQTKDGIPFEKRWYTQEVDSDLLGGYKEVVPFQNPETGKPLMTTFADANKFPVEGITVDPRWSNVSRPDLGYNMDYKPQQGDHATELVAKHAGWLSGETDIRDGNRVTPDDFLNARNWREWKDAKAKMQGADLTSKGKPYDAEIIKSSQVKQSGGNASGQLFREIDTGGKSSQAVKKDILDEMKRTNGNLIDTIQSGPYDANPGKVLDGYSVIQTEYPDEYARANTGHSVRKQAEINGRPTKINIVEHKNDKITEPPTRVKKIDPIAVEKEIRDLGPNIPADRVQVYGGTYSRAGKNKVTYSVGEGSPGLQDLSGKGNTPQILKNLDFITKPEAPVRQVADKVIKTVKGVAKNPAVRMAGVALGAIPVLGDAADASTGAIDVATKKGDAQVRGAGNLAAGTAGLATLAAPVAAPILAPVSIGLGVGNTAADIALERRKNSKDLTINSDKGERAGAFIHSEANPVTISGPSRPTTARGWWDKALGALRLN